MISSTEAFIDRAIGLAGAACVVGLAMKLAGWWADVPTMGQIGDWLSMPAPVLLATMLIANYVAYLIALPYLLVRIVVRAIRGDWPLG